MNVEIAEALIRLCRFGPLVFAGLMMWLDPRSALDLLGLLQDGIHRFQGFLTNQSWFQPYAERRAIPYTNAACVFMRSAGIFLTCYALAGVAGIAR